MAIDADQETEEGIAELVRRGVYPSAQEFLRESLELAQFRFGIADGIDQLERGEGIPGEQVFARLRERSRKYREGK